MKSRSFTTMTNVGVFVGLLSAALFCLILGQEVRLEVDGSTFTLFVDEAVGNLSACAVISELPTDPTVTYNVTIATQENTANSPGVYLGVNEELVFTMDSDATMCVDILIVDDNTVEETETFTVSLTSTSTDVTVAAGRGLAFILISNDDDPLVGLEKSVYTVGEGNVSVQVCAAIQDPQGPPVVVTFVTTFGTADENDFFGNDRMETIPSWETRVCVNIGMMDDNMVEDVETFTVSLRVNSIPVPDESATVEITDNDGATIAVQSTSLSVEEGNSGSTTSVEVCVLVQSAMDGLDRNVTVSLTTTEGTAGADDFVAIVDQMLELTTVNVAMCQSITIVGDDQMEEDEMFTVTVTPTNPLDMIAPDTVTVTILDDGDVADCGDLSDPENGQVNIDETTFGSRANYTCNEGYILNGTSSRICQADEQWSESEPTCEIADCGDLSDPENGQVSIDETTFGSRANYTCNEGYILNGTSSRVCQADEQWSESEPTCEIVDCGSLPSIDNGTLTLNSTTFGSMARYDCDDGLFILGDATRTCQSNGNWTGSDPTCEEPVDCGPLFNPINGGVLTPDGTFTGAVANYFCGVGFTLEGTAMRTCQITGLWTGSQPTCEVVDCGDLSIINGDVIFLDGTTTFQSEAIYECNGGFSIRGDDTRTCQADGTWSGSDPTCVVGLRSEDDDDETIGIAVGISLGVTALIAVAVIVVIIIIYKARKDGSYGKYVLPSATTVYGNEAARGEVATVSDDYVDSPGGAAPVQGSSGADEALEAAGEDAGENRVPSEEPPENVLVKVDLTLDDLEDN